MSDESKFFRKCKCSHCSLPVSFPAEMAGKTIDCPHCKCPTVLTDEKLVEKVLEKPAAAQPKERRDLARSLEYVGDVLLSLGFFGMVAASVSVGIMYYEGVSAQETLSMIAVGIFSFVPALVVKYLFFALAEIIRLLRAGPPKPAGSTKAAEAAAGSQAGIK